MAAQPSADVAPAFDPAFPFTLVSRIGEGTFGDVFKAIFLTGERKGQDCALKRIRLDLHEEGLPCSALREIALLKELDHPHIVRLLDVVHRDARLFLVFEFLDKDLKYFMDRLSPAPVPFDLAKSLFRQMLLAVEYCHGRGIFHRDLKPQNLLLDASSTLLKVADFGLSRSFGLCPAKCHTPEAVTLWYRAPEVIFGDGRYSTPADIWSLGCIFAEMLTGAALFQGDSPNDLGKRIFRTLGTPTEDTWPGVTSLPRYRVDDPLHPPCSIACVLPPTLPAAAVAAIAATVCCYPLARPTATAALALALFAGDEASPNADEPRGRSSGGGGGGGGGGGARKKVLVATDAK